MKVISNASPLIALGKLKQLGILISLYDDISIPHEVYMEVVTAGLQMHAGEAQDIAYLVHAHHINVLYVALPDPLPPWAIPIDAGELETILLAQQVQADLVLIDNAHARRAAQEVGLVIKGTIGLLLEGLRHHHLTLLEFELLIHNIRTDPDIWISQRLCDEALIRAKQLASS